MYKNYIKRLLDIALSLLGMLILSPIFITCTILLALQNKGKVFYTQERPGLNLKKIKIIKFKSMTDEKGKDGKLLPDFERITWLGKIIRSFSVDELPQLINVIIGDMSLIGPRPLLFKYIPLYNETQKRRHEVRPGITGLAQVSGRNGISWTKKFELDIEYIDNLSFWLDIKIIILTIFKVIKSEGINQSVATPMTPFNGNN